MAYRDLTDNYVQLRKNRNVFSTFSMEYDNFQSDTLGLLHEDGQNKALEKEYEIETQNIQLEIEKLSFLSLIL